MTKAWRTFLLLGLVLAFSFVLLGCEEAGAGAGDKSETASDGVTGTPTALNYLEFDYYGEWDPGSYNTDVHISDDLGTEWVYFWLNDSSDSPAVDVGTYTLDLVSYASGTLSSVSLVFGGTVRGAEYAASESTLEEFGSGLSIQTYDHLVGGSVTVTRSGSEYTFSWNFTTADGDTVSGTYTGVVDRTT